MVKTQIIAGYFMSRRPGPGWEADMRRFPYLGTRDTQGNHLGYDQTDPAHVERHLRWAQAHGVRVFAPIWRGRFDSNWDVAMSRNIDILRPVVGRSRFSIMKWCLFRGNPVPGNQPPKRLDFGPVGSPTQVYTNFVETLTTGLDNAARERIRAFDAATAWSVTAGSPTTPRHLAAVADFVAPRLLSWRDGVTELTVRGTARKVDFIPSITCQYDKSKVKGDDGPTRWARTGEDFRHLVRAAAESLDPIGIAGTDDRAVWVQTFNEWPEGTSCEPSELGEEYPASDPDFRHRYGFEFLEILREELQPFLVRSPREPLLIRPVADAAVATTRPTFRWDRVRANPAVDGYRLQVERLGTGQILFEEVVGDVDSLVLPFGLLQRGQNYRWRVQAHNSKGQGWSDWSSQWTFSVT